MPFFSHLTPSGACLTLLDVSYKAGSPLKTVLERTLFCTPVGAKGLSDCAFAGIPYWFRSLPFKSDGFHFCLHTGADLELWYLQMKLNWKVCNCQGVFSA